MTVISVNLAQHFLFLHVLNKFTDLTSKFNVVAFVQIWLLSELFDVCTSCYTQLLFLKLIYYYYYYFHCRLHSEHTEQSQVVGGGGSYWGSGGRECSSCSG